MAKSRAAKAPGSRRPADSDDRQPPPTVLAANAPPLAAPITAAPAAEALAFFQRGMEVLQRHAYGEAAKSFQAVIMGYPGERALVERARVYLALCERESSRRPAEPRTIEERLTSATAALNNGDDDRAEELARSVLGDEPSHDLALYLLAAIHARRNDIDEALALLAKVLAITPEACAQARADDDFDSLRDSEEFWTMTEPPTAEPSQSRKKPRPKSA